METWRNLADRLTGLALADLPFLVVVTVAVVVLAVGYMALVRRPQHLGAEQRLPGQLIMSLITLVAVVAVVLALPISEEARSSLLGLLGVILSASLALSSTTFVSNAMAGLQLRVVGGFRPGDFIRVGEHFGRVTERGLLHTEIQSEDRDLETIPNLYLVQNPLRVVRSSGTIIAATVSLGYDVPRGEIQDALLAAAESASLTDGFVQVSELGDYAVTYRVAGFLEDVTQLLSARSALRKCALDSLHAAGIEIVSPTFMNQRVLAPERRVLPPVSIQQPEHPDGHPESVMFDKAEAAAHATSLRDELAALDTSSEELESRRTKGDGDSAEIDAELKRLQHRREILGARLERIEEVKSAE